ncbi:MAG: RusA family crossover junction endodeoxyribonuclease [Candidatus Omnitrophica bacterium]|nr:RusA family crossover junction endodeoxyribonuclease [Candidatus Omnitrophota bacterium]
MIKLIINGRPKSKDNEKFFNPRTRRPFTSEKFKSYEFNVKLQAKEQMNKNRWEMFTEPVFVKMTFFFINHIRMDLFNCPKSVCDALNKVVWKDDRLIHKGNLEIAISPDERIEIEVWPL